MHHSSTFNFAKKSFYNSTRTQYRQHIKHRQLTPADDTLMPRALAGGYRNQTLIPIPTLTLTH
jgi:hypothetical protein